MINYKNNKFKFKIIINIIKKTIKIANKLIFFILIII
jgi:hypothetical protein